MNFPNRPDWLKLPKLTDKQLRVLIILGSALIILAGVLNFSRCKKVVQELIISPVIRAIIPVSDLSVPITSTAPMSVTSSVAPIKPTSTLVSILPSKKMTSIAPVALPVTATVLTPTIVAPEPTDPLAKLFKSFVIGETTYQEIEHWVNSGEYQCHQFWIETSRNYLKIGPPNGQITMDLTIYSTNCYARLFDKTILPRAEIRLRLISPPCRRDIVVVKRAQYYEYDSDGWHTICLTDK